MPLTGHRLAVAAVSEPGGTGVGRKLGLAIWLIVNSRVLIREILRADAVHVPIPGDIGTLGMLLAFLLRKPLFVRHCGNWFIQKTAAEQFWKWFMERFAGGKNVMLVTGGATEPPSPRNPNLHWIFSTSLTRHELETCFTRRLPLSSERRRLIIVCRQDREKGAGIVIKSLPVILKYFPNITLDVVGDGGALDEFKALANELQVEQQITFHGKVNHAKVLGLLQQADLFCYPTKASEGFPKVVLEALACGLPVITTRVSVLPQLIRNGSGVLLEEATPEALSEAVINCLNGTNDYAMMSTAAVKTAQSYSLEGWREAIGERLNKAWGKLQTDA